MKSKSLAVAAASLSAVSALSYALVAVSPAAAAAAQVGRSAPNFKVNEKTVLQREEVSRAFAQGKVAVLVGDWTGGDAAIGRFLESQGRSGVPLYIHYAPGKAPEILPQLLTVSRIVSLTQ